MDIHFTTLRFLITLFAMALLGACSNVETKTGPKDDTEYTTGSRIPRKDAAASGVTLAPASALEGLQRSSGGPTTKGADGVK
ncbi:MAG: hypothetical protein ABIS68_11475 [Casimicrobiaceae bacterium]